MKKLLTLTLLLPTAIMVISGAANAQRKNTTSHDVPPKIEAQSSETIKKDCHCDCKHHKKNKKYHENKELNKEKASQN